MKREPSIHITKSALLKLTKEFYFRYRTPELLVNKIFENARKYTLRHRSILESNRKTAQRVSKIQMSSKEDALVFSKLYTMVRRRMKHQVKPITDKDGVQWDYVNQAAGLARNFSEAYELDYHEEGCLQYITLGVSIMKPISINKFRNSDERIRNLYEANLEIQADSNADTTGLIYEIYQAKANERTGYEINYREQPAEYLHFIKAADICTELGVTPAEFITAQFTQLDWTNSFPTPSQLSTFKARERAIKYLTESGHRIKKTQAKRNKIAEQMLKDYENHTKQ